MSLEFRRKNETDEHTHISDDYEKNTFIPPFNADQARRLSDEKRALMEAQNRDVIEESKRQTMAGLEAITRIPDDDEIQEQQLKAEQAQIAAQQSLGNRGLESFMKRSQTPSFVELMTQRGVQRAKEREQEQQHRNEEEGYRQAEEARMRQERASAQHRNMYDDLTPFGRLMTERAKESNKSEFDP